VGGYGYYYHENESPYLPTTQQIIGYAIESTSTGNIVTFSVDGDENA
jgi:hypothetical protein